MKISVSSTFVDWDAHRLVREVILATGNGQITADLACIISTREPGDNWTTDGILNKLKGEFPEVPIVSLSARKFGRLQHPNKQIKEQKEQYDSQLLLEINKRSGGLPQLNMMLGDMIVKGPEWCRLLPSLNVHPDIPRTSGIIKGMYWQVIGEVVRKRVAEFGGMIHLAVPELDAGPPVSFFRLPSFGTVHDVNLKKLWDLLPGDSDELAELIRDQVSLKDCPTHQLFIALRQAEASFETALVLESLRTVCAGGIKLETALDLTDLVVGSAAIWPEGEGVFREPYNQPPLREG